jgi:hypothetical protein
MPSDIKEAVRRQLFSGAGRQKGFAGAYEQRFCLSATGSLPAPRPRSSEMVPFVTLASARDPADLRRLVTPGETPRAGARSGHRALLLAGGCLEYVRPTSELITDQEAAHQRIMHLRRSVGYAAELEGERLVAARRVMHAAGRPAKDAQRRRFATVNSLSRDTLRPPVDGPLALGRTPIRSLKVAAEDRS